MSTRVVKMSERFGQVEVNLFGDSLDEILELVRSEFTEYPPQGYGTSLLRLFHSGTYQATVKRSVSCD